MIIVRHPKHKLDPKNPNHGKAGQLVAKNIPGIRRGAEPKHKKK